MHSINLPELVSLEINADGLDDLLVMKHIKAPQLRVLQVQVQDGQGSCASMIGGIPRATHWIISLSESISLVTSKAIMPLFFFNCPKHIPLIFRHHMDHYAYFSLNQCHYLIRFMPTLGPCQAQHHHIHPIKLTQFRRSGERL